MRVRRIPVWTLLVVRVGTCRGRSREYRTELLGTDFAPAQHERGPMAELLDRRRRQSGEAIVSADSATLWVAWWIVRIASAVAPIIHRGQPLR